MESSFAMNRSLNPSIASKTSRISPLSTTLTEANLSITQTELWEILDPRAQKRFTPIALITGHAQCSTETEQLLAGTRTHLLEHSLLSPKALPLLRWKELIPTINMSTRQVPRNKSTTRARVARRNTRRIIKTTIIAVLSPSPPSQFARVEIRWSLWETGESRCRSTPTRLPLELEEESLNL